MKKTLLLIWIAIQLAMLAYSQDTAKAWVSGRLVDEEGAGLQGIQLSLPRAKLLGFTDAFGAFHFSQVRFGTHLLLVSAPGLADTLKIFVDRQVVDLGTIELKLPVMPERPFSPAEEAESREADGDEGGPSRNISSLLHAGRDPFQNTVAYTFSSYRFKARGYPASGQEVLINGIPMNDLETGDAYWGIWGGLNDAFRKRSNTYGLFLSEHGTGGLNGAVDLDATAASQRKQTKLTWSLSNRAYNNRIMITHNSGLGIKGWAWSLSASKRWSGEGYVDGTFYDSYSCYAAVSKQIGPKQELSLTGFGASSRRGKAAPVTQEVTDLTASATYNPDWGYQDGKMRNAKIANYFQPVLILRHQFQPSDKLRWTTSVSYQFGKNANASLDWYNGSDPRPDYYRYLPSWQFLLYGNDSSLGALRALTLTDVWMEDPQKRQIDWDRLYNVNYANTETIRNINGNPSDSLSGKRSVYVQSNDVDDLRRTSLNTELQKIYSDHVTLYTGFNWASQKMESYRQLLDLLGGDFYLNLNQFAETSYPGNEIMDQNDLDHPNRLIRKGDKYSYDYRSLFTRLSWWGQAALSFDHIDAFAAISFGASSFKREGLYRNGLYADNSLGSASLQRFNTRVLKAGITYKVDGRNYLFLNGSLTRDAPLFDNTYISPRNRNLTIDHPSLQETRAAEGGYLLRGPKVNGRVVGYITDIKGASSIKRFYSDDDRFRSFVNYVLQDINMRFTGLELALDAKLNASLNITGVTAIGQAFYTDRPRVSIYKDNDTVSVAVPRTVYVRDFYLGNGPQSAYSLGFNYHSRQYWYASLAFNYFDRNYVEIAPDRRSQEAADRVAPGSDEYHELFDQERLPAFFTADLFIGKSFLLSKTLRFLPRSTYLYLNFGINNLLGKKDLKTGGFEQLRYDFKTNSPGTFPTKYFYGYGRNYFLNLSIKI